MAQHGSNEDQWTVFLDRLVHDMREPLRSIQAFSELLAEMASGRLGSEGDHVLNQIVAGTSGMRTMLENVSAYSAALQSSESSVKGTSLRTAFRIAAANLKDQIHASGATVTDAEPDKAPKLDIGLEGLARLLENLIANALRFRADAAPVIRVSAARESDGMWAVCVEDNGIGIEPGNREAIFLPFMRVYGRKYPGTGLGLSICKAIVESRGGTIRTEPAPEGGSIFRFTLPDAQVSY